jgi:hypothetical protein
LLVVLHRVSSRMVNSACMTAATSCKIVCSKHVRGDGNACCAGVRKARIAVVEHCSILRDTTAAADTAAPARVSSLIV